MTLVKSPGTVVTLISLVVTLISLSVVTPLFAATRTEAQSQLGSPSSKTVRGEVAAVEGEWCVQHEAYSRRPPSFLEEGGASCQSFIPLQPFSSSITMT